MDKLCRKMYHCTVFPIKTLIVIEALLLNLFILDYFLIFVHGSQFGGFIIIIIIHRGIC